MSDGTKGLKRDFCAGSHEQEGGCEEEPVYVVAQKAPSNLSQRKT